MGRSPAIRFPPANAAVYLTVAVAIALVLSVAALPRMERFFIIQAGERSEATLSLAVEGLRGALRRHEPMPSLIAERPILRQLLNDPGNERLVAIVNEQMRQSAIALQASDVYLMDATGLTIAASSYRKELSFVGRRFDYRPYFTQALAGGLGRFFALGTTSGERGYFFASPVMENDAVIGVVAVKFTVDDFEAIWRGGAEEIVVTDMDGIVFMSSREQWHFRALSQLTDDILGSIKQARQYPLDLVTPIPNTVSALNDEISLMRIADGDTTEEFVASTMAIPDAGWRITILTPTGPARTQALAVLAIVVLAVLFAGLSAGIVLQRRARLVERLEEQRATQELLERRVAERTADLNTANLKLTEEVDERRAAEDRLRKTQAELVQAGKLAALGQMSAALSHEYNQPLAAVKAYADNAATFLDRERPDMARENIGRISKMADRMATISQHLRNFARRPQERIGPIELVSVLDEALELMAARTRASGADVSFERPQAEIWVTGGRVRLQQVLVNLLNNALDAMEVENRPRIDISIGPQDDGWRVEVRDHGPGVDTDVMALVFDPFFTTKAPGKGLGLGLSISYNIVEDFGGRLSARNHADGGAVFTVELPAAQAPASQAGAPEIAAE